MVDRASEPDIVADRDPELPKDAMQLAGRQPMRQRWQQRGCPADPAASRNHPREQRGELRVRGGGSHDVADPGAVVGPGGVGRSGGPGMCRGGPGKPAQLLAWSRWSRWSRCIRCPYEGKAQQRQHASLSLSLSLIFSCRQSECLVHVDHLDRTADLLGFWDVGAWTRA